MSSRSRSTYDPRASYRENFENAPEHFPEHSIPPVTGTWTLGGRKLNSPLGIAAGPLLNGRWAVFYARLGFDLVTYKTVRSRERDCYPLPNLVPVDAGQMTGDEEIVHATPHMEGSWAVSFGMPSMAPEFWQQDIAWTKSKLGPGQLLSVSVVGTIQPDWTIDDLAQDYANCARTAYEHGADCIEMNFSCPNVSSRDGQLFQQPDAARTVANATRKAVGPDCPLLVKIGFLPDDVLRQRLFCALAEVVDVIVTTNSVSARIQDAQGQPLFAGERRGICGRATRDAAIDQVRRSRAIIDTERLPLELIGVGGIATADDVRQYLRAGASLVQLATAAMVDPEVGLQIREQLSAQST